MGVDYQHFIVYGYELPYGTFHSDDIDENEKRFDYYPSDQSEGEVVIISDGRSGEYCYTGIVQYKSDSMRGGMPTIEPQSLESATEQQIIALHRVLWQEFDVDPSGEPEHFVLTHIT